MQMSFNAMKRRLLPSSKKRDSDWLNLLRAEKQFIHRYSSQVFERRINAALVGTEELLPVNWA